MQFTLHEKVNTVAVETSLHAALKSFGWSQPAGTPFPCACRRSAAGVLTGGPGFWPLSRLAAFLEQIIY